MEKSQREYYLNEQVKAIQKELGEGEDGADLDELEKKVAAAKMPKEALDKANAELKKLKLMSPMSAEATVVRNYIDTLVSLPWKKKSKVNNDLSNAEKVLEGDHYGLEKVKERILEYLVQQRVDKLKRLSCASSVLRAWARPRWASRLRVPPTASSCAWPGGVRRSRDPRSPSYLHRLDAGQGAAIAGQGRRAQPAVPARRDRQDGRGLPWRSFGAAGSARSGTEPHVLDHYIEVDFDLSDVMFVATSNSYNIPPALLDRMEVIRLSGYTEDEKTSIAQRYLLPKQIKNNGLKEDEISVAEARCATSSATTRVKLACVRWSAKCRRSAARW
jgi:ATP-dependent Lon protease